MSAVGIAAATARVGIEFTLAQLCALQSDARALDLNRLRLRAAHPGTDRQSRLRGRGIDYMESRVYQPGDDIRSMDWRVTARSGRPHTKLYQEENARQTCLLVDFGASLFFGTRRVFKSVAAAEAAALLCWAAVQQGARVGAVVANSTRYLHVRDRDGRRGALAILQALVSLGNARGLEAISLSATLRRARLFLRPGTLIPVISDFARLGERDEEELVQLGRHNQLLLTHVYDPLEAAPPPPGRYAITDGREVSVIDTGAAKLCADYRYHFEARRRRLQALADRLAMPLLSVCTASETVVDLARGLPPRTHHFSNR